MAESYYEGVKEVMLLTSNRRSSCKICNIPPAPLEDAVNHLLSTHGYKLLHVGAQSSHDSTGGIVHDIAFVLGK